MRIRNRTEERGQFLKGHVSAERERERQTDRRKENLNKKKDKETSGRCLGFLRGSREKWTRTGFFYRHWQPARRTCHPSRSTPSCPFKWGYRLPCHSRPCVRSTALSQARWCGGWCRIMCDKRGRGECRFVWVLLHPPLLVSLISPAGARDTSAVVDWGRLAMQLVACSILRWGEVERCAKSSVLRCSSVVLFWDVFGQVQQWCQKSTSQHSPAGRPPLT